jgi:hypothetical protein
MTMTTDEEIRHAYNEIDPTKFDIKICLELPALQLMAVHGAICLGLRHPNLKAPSRAIILEFVAATESAMVHCGLISQKHVALIHKVEQEETEKLEVI